MAKKKSKYYKVAEARLRKASKAIRDLHLINDYLEVYYDAAPKPSEQLGWDCGGPGGSRLQEDNDGR